MLRTAMLRTLFAFAALLFAAVATRSDALPAPELYVVMFRADWCAPCKVVEPRLQAVLDDLDDAEVEYVLIDISTPAHGEVGAHAAFDREIVPQYNRWLGLTGFAAVVDATTKQTLGCVNMLYDRASMAAHIRNLKTHAVADQPSLDITCPPPNNPVG